MSFVVLLALSGCADTDPPTWTEGEVSIEGEPGALQLAWPAANDPSGVEAYLVRIDGAAAARLAPTSQRYSLDDLDSVVDHAIEVVAVDSVGNESTALGATLPGDHEPPVFGAGQLQATAEFEAHRGAPQSVVLRWPAATDDIALAAYLIRLDDGEVTRIARPQQEATLRDVDLGEAHAFTVVAVDEAGNESAPLTTRDAFPPSFPYNARLEEVATGPADAQGLRLEWPAATDDVGVVAYAIRRGTEEVARVDASILSHDLGPGAPSQGVAVVALDAAGHECVLRGPSPGLAAEIAARDRMAMEVAVAMREAQTMLLGSLGDSGGRLSDMFLAADVDDERPSAGVGVAMGEWEAPGRATGGGTGEGVVGHAVPTGTNAAGEAE
ncbi:MAG: hypothetical protein DRJ42_19395 [Deltaproteobacteria bacterium]|nr:MAG: hypothetical protein DRJ42_19395 [Deltaproteobacteria bacterium]